MTKRIGIPGWVVDDKVFGVTLPYAEFINAYGTMVILAPDSPVDPTLDLLILPGGADITPSRFVAEQKPSYYTNPSNPHLDWFDAHRLPEYLRAGVPILGICRGSQCLWHYFGGELIQHNPQHTQSATPTDECHELHWLSEDLQAQYGLLLQKVNSRHHQSMSVVHHTPADIEVLALAKDNGLVRQDIVELFRHRHLPVFGYQPHPEAMPSDRLTALFVRDLLTRKNSLSYQNDATHTEHRLGDRGTGIGTVAG